MQEVVCRSTPYAMLELTSEGKVVWDQIGTLWLFSKGKFSDDNLVAVLKLGSEESSGKSQA